MAKKCNYKVVTVKRDYSGLLNKEDGVIEREGELEDITFEDMVAEFKDGDSISILIVKEEEEKDI